jgi:capsular polysaccharide biosynthesis protein
MIQKVWGYDTYRVEEIDQIDLKGHKNIRYLENVFVQVCKEKILIYIEHDDSISKDEQFHFKSINILPRDKPIINIEDGLLLHVKFRNVYFHWVYDLLPQLSFLAYNSNVQLITCPFHFKYQTESLHYFAPGVNICSSESIFKVARLYLPTQSTFRLMPFPFVFEFLRSNLDQVIPSNKIYITRKSKYKRSILNESGLIMLLKKRGFDIYSLEDISFGAQIIIFQKASFIISAHGSGLSNIAFCQPGVKLLEIYGPGCGERCFARISSHLKIDYHAFEVCERQYENYFKKIISKIFPTLDRYDFIIDLFRFNQLLAKIFETKYDSKFDTSTCMG